MAEIPDIVKQRLVKAEGGVHPDANLLAAFAERSLPRREQRQLTEHLAACASCREIVALAVPSSEATTAVAALRGRSPWLSWPVLRWGALGACVIIVGAAVTLRHPRQQSADVIVVERQAPQQEMAKAGLEGKAPSSNAMAVNRVNAVNRLNEDRQPASRSGSKVPPAPTPDAERQMMASRSRTLLPAGESSQEAANQEGEQDEPETVPTIADSNETAVTAAKSETTDLVPGKAKEAQQDLGSPMSAVAGGALAEKRQMAASAPTDAMMLTTPDVLPRWTLSADGTLQRSLDAGRNWKMITVSNRTIFRALAANGLDIWVGGSGGALYHSSDAGEHWLRVQPAANDETLTSDIIGVEFPDTLHGKVTTSGRQIWITADAGQTWQKQ